MAELNQDALLSISVPDFIQQGVSVIKWSENPGSIDLCKLQVDEYGFFLGWSKKGKDNQVLDFSHVTDIRLGICPNDPVVLKTLSLHHKDIDPVSYEGNEILGTKTLTICSYDNDLVDVAFTNFVFLDEKSRNDWHTAITSLGVIGTRRNLSPSQNLVKTWKKLLLSFNIRGKVPLKAISKIFGTSSSIEKQVQRTAQELGISGGKISESIAVKDFTLDTFVEICNIILPRKDIDSLFQSITAGEEATISQLIKFINNQQRDPRLNKEKVPLYTKTQVLEIIKAYEKNTVLADMGLMSKDGFTAYLLSSENSMIKKEHLDIFQNMDQPLSHYFISSSHNTYLEGAQVKGKSSVEMYRQVLLTGCRCIELDCWDGSGPNSREPIITHGNAFCTEILFKDVIKAIKECAFIKSPYPLVLSFENHCSKLMQEKMAEYCEKIMGELLLTEPLEDFPTTTGKLLPSPNKLKHKILIKNKKLEKTKEEEGLEQYWKMRKAIEAIKESRGNISGPTSFVHLGGVGENAFAMDEMRQGLNNDTLNIADGTDKSQDDEQGSNTDNSNQSDSDSDTLTQKTFISNSGAESCFKIKDMKITENKEKDLDSWSEGEEDTATSPSESPIDAVEFMGESVVGDVKKVKRKKGIFGISLKGKRKVKQDDAKSIISIGSIEEENNNFDSGSINSEADVVLRHDNFKNNKKNRKSKKVKEIEREQRKSMIKPQIGNPSAFVHVTGSVMKINQTLRAIDIDGGETSKETIIEDKLSNIDEELFENEGSDKEEYSISISSNGKSSVSDDKKEGGRKKSKNENKPVPTKFIHPYLSSMVIYTISKPFKGFYVAENDNLSNIICSFSETKAFDLIKSNSPMFVRFNARQMSRIYPTGTRIGSSNLMPQEFWNTGCQLVSLNYQTPDPPMQLNLGKFDFNGQSGYILKPDIMRGDSRTFDPSADKPLDGIVPANLSVQILSGYFLSDRKVGTYVVVEMHGLSADTSHKEFRTNVIPANGVNPVYNSKVFNFPKIIFPELAMLRFAVFDDHDKLLGQRVVPLEAIHCGYRHINLRTVGNATLPLSMLFCKIKMDTYTPCDLQSFADALANPQEMERTRKQSERKESQIIKEDDSEISTPDVVQSTDNSSSGQSRTKMKLAKTRNRSVINN